MSEPLLVLFIEDNPDDSVLLTRELRKGGFDVDGERVDSAAALREALGRRPWQVAVSDYVMPGFGGPEALKIVLASGLELPFIMISGTVGEEVAVESMKAGATDYLMKHNLIRLVPAVRRALEGVAERRLRRDAEARERELQERLVQSQKLEALGTLAGGIAHDFNNLLTCILGYGEMAQLARPTPPVADFVNEIVSASKRASELVGQILTFSRPRAGKRSPHKLGAVVREVGQLLRASTPASVTAEVRLPDTDVIVSVDAGQIHQVLVNLWTNAVHAMPGGGRLTVTLERVDLDAATARVIPPLGAGPYAKLTVADTGAGMDAATLGRAFEPFFTTKPAGSGTGLGLSVVHGLVRDHGGAVTAASTPGAGSTFCVYLPVATVFERVEEAPAAPPPGRGERVLLVDDEVAVLRVTAEMLTALGYAVTAEVDARQALALFTTDPTAFDVVLTDLSMPLLSGRVLIAKLRALLPDVPIVATTGFGRDSDIGGLQALKDCELLNKPFRLQELGEAVARALGRS